MKAKNKLDKKTNIVIIILVAIIIVILSVLCILFATNTISFNSKVNSNIKTKSDTSSNKTNQTETTNTTVSSENEKTWEDYLVSCHILNAKISRSRSKDLGDNIDVDKTISLTINDVNNIMKNLKNYNLTKSWSLGMGGYSRDKLVIDYEKNDSNYTFELINGIINVDKLDDTFKEILDSDKTNEINTEYKDTENSFYYYNLDNYSDTLFDSYFN